MIAARSLLALSLVAGCASPATTAPPVSVAPTATAIAPLALSPSPSTTSRRPAEDATPSGLEEKLRRHFAQYQGGANFAFFEQDFASRVDRYLRLKDVAASELARAARVFYADKKRVSLAPRPGSLTVTNEGQRAVASFILALRWSYPPPAAAAACGYLDESMSWRPHSLIARHVEVTARITFDADAKIVVYEEAPLAPPPLLRVATRGDALLAFAALPTVPARAIEGSATSQQVPDGTIVEDLGETFICGLDQTEVDTVRKVRLQGRTIWLLADWTYDTGHNFVGDTLLVPHR